MPWQIKEPTPDAIVRRIAYHIAVRAKEQGVKNIAERAGVSVETLRNYSCYQFAPGTSGGALKFNLLLRIVMACGDDFANVFWAAQESTDHQSFYQILTCELVAQQSLVITAANERRATRRLFTQTSTLSTQSPEAAAEAAPAPLRAVT